jgi:hypothetical protein
MKLLPITIGHHIYSLNVPPMTVAHALLINGERAFLTLRLMSVGEKNAAEALSDVKTKYPELNWQATDHKYAPSPTFRLPANEPNVRYIELLRTNGNWDVVSTDDNEDFLRAQSELGAVASGPAELAQGSDALAEIRALRKG